jgi:hypothetical protein
MTQLNSTLFVVVTSSFDDLPAVQVLPVPARSRRAARMMMMDLTLMDEIFASKPPFSSEGEEEACLVRAPLLVAFLVTD